MYIDSLLSQYLFCHGFRQLPWCSWAFQKRVETCPLHTMSNRSKLESEMALEGNMQSVPAYRPCLPAEAKCMLGGRRISSVRPSIKVIAVARWVREGRWGKVERHGIF